MSKKIFIGVGHGGSDSGAMANGLKEKRQTKISSAVLLSVLKCRNMIKKFKIRINIIFYL